MKYKMWAGGVLVLVVGFLLGWGAHPGLVSPQSPTSNPQVAADAAVKTVSLMVDFGDGTVKTFQNIDIGTSKNVFDVTKKLSETGNGFVFHYQPPGQYGILVDQIGNKKGGDEGEKYWLFWVNNAEAQQSADNTAVKSGDVIEWKFIKQNFEEGASS